MAKSFKDFVESDIANAFMNEDEYSEKALIQGVEMDVIPETTAYFQGDKKNQIAVCDVVFHVSSSYFKEIPQAEKMLNYNNKTYVIKAVNEDMGMLTIGLLRNKS